MHAAKLWGARWDEALAIVEKVFATYERREARRAARRAHLLLKRIVPLVVDLRSMMWDVPEDLYRDRWNEKGPPLGLADRGPMSPIANVALMLSEQLDEIIEARDAAQEVATARPGQHLRREIAGALMPIAPSRDTAAAMAYLALAVRIDRPSSPTTWDKFRDVNVDRWKKLLRAERAGGSGR